jgi:pimeloyl-ACP methyl ester carboxylesterase
VKQPLRHLIVVIPGIGGSVLERDGTPVWGDGLPRLAARMLCPRVLSLAPDDGVRAVRLIRSASILPGLTVMHGYRELVRALCNRFTRVILDENPPDDPPHPDANVILFPYDFRQSVEDTAAQLAKKVHTRLDGLDDEAKPRRVVVIAHSMGGLVARYWLGPLDGWRCCRALVTLGTPHRGAPKALDWLVNGVRLKGVRLPAATTVIQGWPSVYELLPRYPAVMLQTTDRPCYPYELTIDGFNAQRALDAFELHQRIEQAWEEIRAQPDGPSVVPFLGRGHPTLERASWTGALSVTKDRADWLDQPPDWFGDGTVPAYMASPIEQDKQRDGWHLIPVRHGALPSYEGVLELLEAINSESEDKSKTPVRGEEEERACLGVDLEEWYPGGDPVPVEVFLRPALHAAAQKLDMTTVRVWASATPEHGGSQVIPPVALERAGERWVGQLGGLAPGFYQLKVSATRVPGGEPRPVREIFEIVDPSEV